MKWRQPVLLLLCLLLLIVQQLRIIALDHRVNDLYESHLRLQEEMVKFMDSTTDSIINNTRSIESHTRILRKLFH